ncbi:hypothetical protein H0176_14795 [Methylorubrum populi]|nr:hypothetical protein [Methylorubrum sp. DB1722]MBK3402537.1 hypothetical protein [Methylorubrum rhodesianum]MBY0141539.1 hypothetical protein [Methylorubrum populi]
MLCSGRGHRVPAASSQPPSDVVGPTSASTVTDRTPASSTPHMHIREEMLSLMQALADGIRIDGLMADQLSQIADRARLCGEGEMADGLLGVTRQHRVAVLEGQGRLAALEARYAILFPDEA